MLGRSVPYLLVRSENVNAFIRKDTVEIKKKKKILLKLFKTTGSYSLWNGL